MQSGTAKARCVPSVQTIGPGRACSSRTARRVIDIRAQGSYDSPRANSTSPFADERLPRMNESTSTPRIRGVHGAVREEPRRRLRALVLDDDHEILAFAAEALNSFAPGFDVATARDPQRAAAWLETFQPDLLITELKFAGEGTGALPDRLRVDPRTRHCRVLVTSSLA